MIVFIGLPVEQFNLQRKLDIGNSSSSGNNGQTIETDKDCQSSDKNENIDDVYVKVSPSMSVLCLIPKIIKLVEIGRSEVVHEVIIFWKIKYLIGIVTGSGLLEYISLVRILTSNIGLK